MLSNGPINGTLDHPGDQRRTDFLFRVSLKAVIFDEDGNVLVVKETDRDWWDLPGGGIDHGESLKETLGRELHEEVSLADDFAYEVVVVEDPRYLEEHNFYQMRVVFLVKPENLSFSPGDDGDEVSFVDPLCFKDSESTTERKIYEYSQLAEKRLNATQ